MQGLQVFSESNTEAVQGKKIVYLYRLLKEQRVRKESHLRQKTDVPSPRMQIQLPQKMERSVRRAHWKLKSQRPAFWQKGIQPLISWKRRWITMNFWRSGK